MASIRQIKHRIRSAQNIAKITRAMQMVAASKMKKAQDKAVMGKPYVLKLGEATRELAERTNRNRHPLLALGNPDGKVLGILISTTKGLCGGLNTNLFRVNETWHRANATAEYVTIGKKGQSYILRTHKTLVADYSEHTVITDTVAPLTKFIVDGFQNGTYKSVYLMYNSFINALKYEPLINPVLPISSLPTEGPTEKKEEQFTDFLIEPNIDDLLDFLLPHYLENQIRAALLEAEASEQSARMVAMKNATEAAEDLTNELTLIYNKVRQEKITYEIADIVTARLAVE